MSVGFGGAIVQPIRAARIPMNPLDNSTIVSVYPREIREVKITLSPGTFVIPAAPVDGFSIAVISSASWFKEMEEGQPALEIQQSSLVVAKSIIHDYMNGLVGCNMADRMPGLFYVPGKYNKTTILTYKDENGKTFAQHLEEARAKQKNWYMELVKFADTDWARTNGNPRSVSDDSRMAAASLGLEKPWMQDFKAVAMVNCKACGSLVNPAYPVCSNCKTVINEEKAKELGLKFVV